MDVILVRHGQSTGNAEGRMQGQREYPLSELGVQQAHLLSEWFKRHGVGWQAAYVSPQSRALQTYDILSQGGRAVAPVLDPDLREVHAGSLEGLNRERIERDHPLFLERDVTQLGDFSPFGGESYDAVQERVARVWSRISERHRSTADCAMIVSHGGLLFQLLKAAVCMPVPRVAILRFSNCTATKLHFRDRRGSYLAELNWHVPIELMGGVATANVSRWF